MRSRTRLFLSARDTPPGQEGRYAPANFAKEFPTQALGLLAVADFCQHAGDETKQLVERVESYCLVRCDVFDFPLDPPRINIRLRSKLDNEGRLVLPSTHQEQTIVGRAL